MGRGDLVLPLATQIRTQYFLKSRLFLGMLTETNKNLADRKKLGKCWAKSGRLSSLQASHVAQVVKSLPANAGDLRDVGLIPGLESSGEGIGYPFQYSWASLVAQTGKDSVCSGGDLRSIPGLGKSPEGGHGNPLQYSCLENPHGQRSLSGYSPWGRKELDTTEVTEHTHMHIYPAGLFRTFNI